MEDLTLQDGGADGEEEALEAVAEDESQEELLNRQVRASCGVEVGQY